KRTHSAASAAKDKRRDRHSLRIFPTRGNARALTRGRGETRVWVGGLVFAIPRCALPVREIGGRILVLAFPPWNAVRIDGDVREDRVLLNSFERGGIRVGTRAGHYAEEASLGIYSPQPTVGTD